MQEGCHDIKKTNVMILVGSEFVSARMSLWWKMTKAMILVGLEFVSARMSLWKTNDQSYDISGIRVCKCKKVVMT